MTAEVPGKLRSKNERSEELARAGGRDGWALTLGILDVADAIRELTAVIVERVPVLPPPAVRVPTVDNNPVRPGGRAR